MSPEPLTVNVTWEEQTEYAVQFLVDGEVHDLIGSFTVKDAAQLFVEKMGRSLIGTEEYRLVARTRYRPVLSEDLGSKFTEWEADV